MSSWSGPQGSTALTAAAAGQGLWSYRGPISFEYEKFWYPEDLADAEVGLAQSLAFVRKFLAAVGCSTSGVGLR
jgi:hypothetical protein